MSIIKTFSDNVLDPSKVPAFFATSPSPKMTERYGFMNTYDVVKLMTEEMGWNLVAYGQKGTNSRSSEDRSYVKHFATFRKTDTVIAGELIPQLRIINSHDGSTRFRAEKEIYRGVCGNGMTVLENKVGVIDIRHNLNTVKDIKPMVGQFISYFDKLSDKVQRMKEIDLATEEQIEFAQLGMAIRWGQHVPKIQAEKLLEAKREEDKGNNLWLTYNKVQEWLIQGGLVGEGIKPTKSGGERLIKTKQVRNIDVEIQTNKGLWELVSNKIETGKFIN